MRDCGDSIMRKKCFFSIFFANCLLLIGVFCLRGGYANASDSERLSHVLEEASALFQDAEYVESYEKYHEALDIDPDHQEAIDRALELAAIFKRSGELWQRQGNPEEAQKNDRLYRQIVRELLELLTGRWQTVLNEYSSRADTEKRQEKNNTEQQLRPLFRNVENMRYL